jgi:hypothetical protein
MAGAGLVGGTALWVVAHAGGVRVASIILAAGCLACMTPVGTVKANFILAFGAGQRGMVTLFLLMNLRRVSCDSRPEMRYTHLL